MDYKLSMEPDDRGGQVACIRGTTAAGHAVELDCWPVASFDAAVTDLESRGWRRASKRSSSSARPVSVAPDSLRPIVDTVTEQRRVAQQAAADWSDALYDLIATMPPKGDPQYVSAIELAKTSGLSRDRVYQIRRAYPNGDA